MEGAVGLMSEANGSTLLSLLSHLYSLVSISSRIVSYRFVSSRHSLISRPSLERPT